MSPRTGSPRAWASCSLTSPTARAAPTSSARTLRSWGSKWWPMSLLCGAPGTFKAQLTTIKAANPDILFIPGYTQETAPAAAQARQLGMKQRILGVYGDMDQVYIELAGPAAEGHVIASEYDEEYNSPKNQAFKKAYYDLAEEKKDSVNIMFRGPHLRRHLSGPGRHKKYGPSQHRDPEISARRVKTTTALPVNSALTTKTTWSKAGSTSWRSRAASTSRCSKDGRSFLVLRSRGKAHNPGLRSSPGNSRPTSRDNHKAGGRSGRYPPYPFFALCRSGAPNWAVRTQLVADVA